MDKKNTDFYNQWIEKSIDYKLYKDDLLNALNQADSLYAIRMSSIPVFTFPIPGIDLEEIKKEANQIITDAESQWHHTAVKGYPDDKKWKIYFVYKVEGSQNRDAAYEKFDDKEFIFVYGDKYPAIKKMIEEYCYLGNPIWLSVLEPGGVIGMHADVTDTPFTLSKMRLPISYHSDSVMLLEGVGRLDYYSDELVLFNHRIPHAVYNNSNENKIDISISILNRPEIFEKIDSAVKEKIKKIISNI